MSADDPHFRLQMPEELHAFIAEAARTNNRSINAEIVFRLQQSISEMAEVSKIHPSDLADKFMTRLPDGFRDRLAALAKRNGRSMNSELVMALTDWLQRHDVAQSETPRSDVEEGSLDAR